MFVYLYYYYLSEAMQFVKILYYVCRFLIMIFFLGNVKYMCVNNILCIKVSVFVLLYYWVNLIQWISVSHELKQLFIK